MRTHVALLRGVNLGGHNRIAMSDLREVATATGLVDVATYVQSGNLVFSSTDTDGASIATALERRIADDLNLRLDVVLLSREELVEVVAANPYPDEVNPKCLHVAFHREDVGPDAAATIATAVQRARDQGSRDEATVIGRAVYLRTPDGFGRSRLAAQLSRPQTARPARGAPTVSTVRNWATVSKLLALMSD